MGTAIDALNTHPSLTSRRSAANNLPSFELPHPNLSQYPNTTTSQKYSLHQGHNTQQSGFNVRVGNLLTPPSNSSPESTGPISGSATSASVPQSGQVVAPYSQGYWHNSNSYNFNTGRNNSSSPTTVDGLPATYDMHHAPPFQSPVPSSGQSPTSHQQQHPQQQQQQQQPQSQQQHQAMSLMSAQATPVSPTPPHQQAGGVDAYGQKLPPTPLYGGSSQSGAPQQQSYQPFQDAPPPPHQGGVSAPTRMSPISVHIPTDGQSQMAQYSRPYPSYSLPAMSGPVMTNVHSPGGQMALMGSMQPNLLPGFNSGHAASMHHLYTGHPHPHPHHMHGLMPPGQQNDRPFRCDICPQSFNRNHDLKRHKRIHLSVKPFPCGHCDKSFSRKDALKRHILVKGCGKNGAGDGNANGSASGPIATDTTGDSK